MTQTIILAAGKGTRMATELPKAMVPLCDIPLLQRVLNAALPISPKPTIIIGYKKDEVIQGTNNAFHYIYQKEQLGSGHAVQYAKAELINKNFDVILVLTCDQPFINTQSLIKLIDTHRTSHAVASLLTAMLPSYDGDFRGFNYYSRIIKNNHNIERVIEYKDASDSERTIKEVSIGGYAFKADWLWDNIQKIKNENAAHEFYLTELFNIAAKQGATTVTSQVENPIEGFGVNTLEELAAAERYCS